MILYEHYQDFNYDYVGMHTLDSLIVDKSIQRFYRPSEERWVNVFRDSIRGIGGDYSEPDRRRGHKTT